MLAFRKYGWNRIQKKPKAPIFLGKTLHKQDPWPFCRKIGVDDENHLVTIAQSRSGKSITVIWPNLVKYAYPDSVFVLDPKGEHAVLTSRHRAAQGQRVYVLDPFNETKGQVERHCFNPLAEIDPSSPRAKNDIKQIAEACVVTAVASISEGGEHFRGLATTVITGLIAHVLTKLPKERRTLPEVYTHFKALRKKEDFESFLPEMEQNPACGNAPSDAVAAYLGSPDKNRGDIFTTILNALEWVSADGMREHLSRSDFSLEELRTHRTSIYVVLDFDDMKPRVQGRYMRVLFNLALRKSYVMPLPPDREQAGRRTLFILDEVGQLEFMPSIQEAYRSHAGKNVKLWCFFQDLKALTSTFTSPNAIHGNSTSQFFGCKDAETAHFIEDHLGEYRHRRKDGDRIYETTKPLLDHSEIMDTLKQESPMQIVMTGGGYRLKLKRKIYIPGPVWKFEDSRFYAFLMRFLEFVRPFRKSIFLRITFGLVFLSAIIWFWVNYNPQNIEWYGVLVYKGVLSWFLLSIWWVVFFLPEETLKKEREERERRQREQREQYWRKTKEMREDFGLVEGFTQGQLDEQALFNLKNVAASEVKQAAWLLRKYKALCYDAVQAEEPDIFGARAYDEKFRLHQTNIRRRKILRGKRLDCRKGLHESSLIGGRSSRLRMTIGLKYYGRPKIVTGYCFL